MSPVVAARDRCSMFRIELTPEAVEDLRRLRKFDQQQIIAAIEKQLPDQAAQETRNRKRLRPNQLAEWELRVGDFRVFYDISVENSTVTIEAVGYKRGSKLIVHGGSTSYEDRHRPTWSCGDRGAAGPSPRGGSGGPS